MAKHPFPVGIVTLLLVPAIAFSAEKKGIEIEVAAGDTDRREVPVWFELPAAAQDYQGVRDSSGAVTALQVESGRGCFLPANLARGTTRTYELVKEPGQSTTPPPVTLARRERSLEIAINGRSVLEYQMQPGALPRPEIKPIFARGGYLHPLTTPDGVVVTDDYPPNHLHHHGVWWSWTKTTFEGRHPDFWNMGDGKGTVEFVSLEATWSGPVHAGFRVTHRYVDLTAPEPRVALMETWEVTVYGVVGKGHLFDLRVVQTCATASPLVQNEYHYGGLGFRGRREWDGAPNMQITTSEGEKDRLKANQTPARWCDLGGSVGGKSAGLAILGHPENFRAPQPMRVHPTEPFFCFAPSQGGDWQIEPGKPYVSRYRFLVHDGPPSPAEAERSWNDFANPPIVTVR